MSVTTSNLTCAKCLRPVADDVDIVLRGEVAATITACAACLAEAHAGLLEQRAVFEALIVFGQCEYDANRGMIAKYAQRDGMFDVPKNGPSWRGLICWPPSLGLFER